MAVHMGSAEKVMTFGGFKRCATGFLAAGVALCDIATCFIACRKSFCVTGAILLRCFPCRGMLRAFANRIVRVVSIGNNVPIPGQAWNFGTCDENWRKLRTKHRF